MHVRGRNAYKDFGRDHLETCIYGLVILKSILKKYSGRCGVHPFG
jgi:hypothetical protein